jgi:predicted GNAT family acetyltransferase
MNLFLEGKLTERELLEQTQPGDNFEAIYLCSAYVLPEFRKQGLTQKLTLDAIKSMQNDHAIKALFYWPFSEEGKQLAQTVASQLMLPLYEHK